MKIDFVCPSCGASFPVELDASGLVLCTCGKQFRARQAGTATPPVTGAAQSPGATSPALPANAVLPQADAEELIRAMAGYYRVPKIIKQLGNVPPKQLAKARATYARAMTDAEVPLLLVNKSYLGFKYGGLLLTNQRVYSSDFNGFFQLAGITASATDMPGLAETILWRSNTLQLTLNGVPFYKAAGNLDFMAALLKVLGEKSRQRAGLEPALASPTAPPEYRPLSAAAAAPIGAIDRSSPEYQVALYLGSGRKAAKAVEAAVRRGATPEHAQEIADQMQVLLPPRLLGRDEHVVRNRLGRLGHAAFTLARS